MTIQQTTPHLGLPLPHPDNVLEDDVARLREALTQIDGSLFTLRSLVASDDVNLDTVQEIVAVLTQAQGDIGNVTALLATKASVASLALLSSTTVQALALKADRTELPAAARLAPPISGPGDSGKIVTVNPAGDGYVLTPPDFSTALFYANL